MPVGPVAVEELPIIRVCVYSTFVTISENTRGGGQLGYLHFARDMLVILLGESVFETAGNYIDTQKSKSVRETM